MHSIADSQIEQAYIAVKIIKKHGQNIHPNHKNDSKLLEGNTMNSYRIQNTRIETSTRDVSQ